jgi:CRISPR-associated protein Csx10
MDDFIRAGGAGMNALTFKIELLEPLLVAQLGSGDENSAQSLDYIPGGVLRNALAARYIASKQIVDAANDPTCRTLFFDDKVRVLNSYRADHLGARSLPTPLSWIAEKEALGNWRPDDKPGDRLTFYDAAVDETVVQEMRDIKTLEKAGRFCRLGEDEVELVGSARQVNVHIQRQHKRELKTKGESQVFVYDALAAGEIFCGAILAQDDAALETFRQMLMNAPEFNIGGSRSAGYGRIRISDVTHNTDWRETHENENGKGEIVIVLLSDAIVRDANGQFTDDIGSVIGVTPTRCFRKINKVGGFNRKWGLPLPQAHAIQAGSVFVYAGGAVEQARLESFVAEGIGEHRQDGFGRIAVNWNTRRELSAQQIALAPKLTTVSLANDAVSQRLAQRIVEHQLRKQLDQALRREILNLRIKGGSKSALARVRLAARRSVFKGDLSPVEDLLKHIKKTGIDNLNKTRIGSDALFDWLKQRKEERDVEQQLKVSLDKLPQVGGVRAELTDASRDEYTARWIEAVVKRAQKEAQS